MALTRLKTALLLAGLAGAIAAPGVAQAQVFLDTWGGRFDVPLAGDEYGRDYDRPFRDADRPYRAGRAYREAAPISRGEIASLLGRRGYRVNPSMARNNDVYVVDAVDPSGRRQRLIVDAFDGTILQRFDSGAPPTVSRGEDFDRWDDDGDFGPAPRQAEPRVIPGVGPTQRKPAPKKPATARVEPRAPAPKPATTEPAPAPATTAAPAGAAETRSPAPVARAQAPAPAAAEPAAPASPRVIPLYKTPNEGGDAKPAEGAP